MAASNRIKAEMYILFSLQRMARIQFIRAKGGLLFHRKGSRLPAEEQKKTETGGR